MNLYTLNRYLFVGATAIALTLSSCSKKKGCTDPDSINYNPEATIDDGSCEYANTYDVPTTYNFDNVSYAGQTVRLLLLEDLTEKIEEAENGTTVTEAELLAIYENTNNLHNDIASGKKLSDKCEASADTLVRDWFKEIETLSSQAKGYTTDDGLNLAELVEKTIMGGVFYYRAVNDYLDGISDDDNNTVTAGEGTDMEHHFDEAFGYFGAARDYNSHTDTEIKESGEFDANSDNTIDPTSEKCFFYAFTAAKRDLATAVLSTTSQTDYTKTIFDACLQARAAISNKDYETRDAAIVTLKKNWDNIIAATAVHYAREVDETIGTSDTTELYKVWSELKGYTTMLSYNPSMQLGETDITDIYNYIGDMPSDMDNADVDAVISIIQNAYEFTDEQVDNF